MTREGYHQTSIPQLESYVVQITMKYFNVIIMATIRKQYWLGMGFSNVYVYADDTVWFHCSSEGNIHCERKTTLSN